MLGKLFAKKPEPATASMPSNAPNEEWEGGETGAASGPAPSESEAPPVVNGPPEPMQCSGAPKASDWHPAHGRFPKGIPSSYGRLKHLEQELLNAHGKLIQGRITAAQRTEIENLAAEIVAIKRHIFKLQQAPCGEPGNAADGWRVYMDRPRVGPGLRASRLEKLLDLIVDLGNPDGHGLKFPAVKDVQLATPKDRLLAEPEIQAQAVAALYAYARAEMFRIENFGTLNPTLRGEELRIAIADCQDLEQLKQLREELRLTSGEEGRIGRRVAMAAQEKADAPAVLELQRLLTLSRFFASEYQLEAIEQEAEYLQQSGLPWSATEKSKRYGALLAELKGMSPGPSVLEWFGVQLPA